MADLPALDVTRRNFDWDALWFQNQHCARLRPIKQPWSRDPSSSDHGATGGSGRRTEKNRVKQPGDGGETRGISISSAGSGGASGADVN